MGIKVKPKFDEAIKVTKKVTKNFEVSIEKTTRDVLFNDMLRDAKINAQVRVLRRGKGRGTGNLASSIFARIKTRNEIVIGSLNVDLRKIPYARIHEFGGTIKSKPGKWLTIPFKGIKGFARDYENTFFRKSKKGNLILFQLLKGKKKIKPLFSLKKQVKIPKRSYLRPAILKHLKTLRKKLKKTLEALQNK